MLPCKIYCAKYDFKTLLSHAFPQECSEALLNEGYFLAAFPLPIPCSFSTRAIQNMLQEHACTRGREGRRVVFFFTLLSKNNRTVCIQINKQKSAILERDHAWKISAQTGKVSEHFDCLKQGVRMEKIMQC